MPVCFAIPFASVLSLLHVESDKPLILVRRPISVFAPKHGDLALLAGVQHEELHRRVSNRGTRIACKVYQLNAI